MRWMADPKSLADSVGDLTTVPGISSQVYSVVAEKWKSSPPSFKGSPITLLDIANFVQELLRDDPFKTDGKVPQIDLRGRAGMVLAVTQRQLAFVVANALMNNTISGGDGLTHAFQTCATQGHNDFIYPLLSFLAILSVELAGGRDGTVLIAATPQNKDATWKDRLVTNNITRPTLCSRVGGASSGCTPDDFMAGGTAFQALTDIAGNDVGGGANLCNVALSQDESLVQFYSEVLAFAFFSRRMLPTPITFLGVRRYVNMITGERQRLCGEIQDSDWLNSDIGQDTVTVELSWNTSQSQKRVPAKMMASSFVAVASALTNPNGCPHGNMVNNNCDSQRRHVDQDIARWYQAYEASMYNPAVVAAIRGVVKRIGTGPWGSGVWFGDSQMYFMTMLLATSLLNNVSLDYYYYDRFCENEGNQCFVLGRGGCAACVQQSGIHSVDSSRCGTATLNDMVEQFAGQSAQSLYSQLTPVGGPPAQVFDLLHHSSESGSRVQLSV